MSWLTTLPIAHRGLHNDERPENSLAAFAAARDGGYPVELDVHLSIDGHVVVFHDRTLERMTGQSGLVAQTTAADLQRLRLGKSAEPIPLLLDVCELLQGAVPLLIEIKNRGAVGPLEAAVTNVLAAYSGDCAVQSFNPRVVRWLQQHTPHILRGQLSERYRDSDLSPFRKLLLRTMVLNSVTRPHFIGYDATAIPSWPVGLARKQGLPVLAWTVRSAAEQQRLRPFVDNIIFEGFAPT
jgi:glycerophosphoryl diester phosphodiesterase